jgi:hypothetical protein
MHAIHRAAAPEPRKRGIRAEVLIDGFPPGPPKERFAIGTGRRLIADYLLASERGFSRVIPLAQHPPYEFIFLLSSPADRDQFRLAFGLSLIEDALELGGRMGFRLRFLDRVASRFIHPAEPQSSIRFLEAMEGVDEAEIRFRYLDNSSGARVKGSFLI